jgi:hypothetical protein
VFVYNTWQTIVVPSGGLLNYGPWTVLFIRGYQSGLKLAHYCGGRGDGSALPDRCAVQPQLSLAVAWPGSEDGR